LKVNNPSGQDPRKAVLAERFVFTHFRTQNRFALLLEML